MVDFLYCNDIRVEQKSNGRKFAYCAYVRFFTGVGSFVHLKIAEVCCWIFTLVAMMCFLPSVFRNVISQRNKLTGWVVVLCASLRRFPREDSFVDIQKVHESMRKSMRAKYAANKFLNYELFREVNSRYVFPAHQGWSSSSKSPSPSTPGFARSLSFTESIWICSSSFKLSWWL